MNRKTVLLLFVSLVSKVVGDSTEDVSFDRGEEGPGPLLDDSKDQSGDPDDSTTLEDDQLLQTVELAIPDESPNQPIFRQHYAREFVKKREFLQCRDEEPIVYMCAKSCHNVFLTVCYDYRCPLRLPIQTQKECHENCKKTYKGLRGQKYIPPEKY